MFDELEKSKRKDKTIDSNNESLEHNDLNSLPKNSLSDHFFSSEKKFGGNKKTEKLEKVGISDQFNKRMQDLHHRGRKRGKRYSAIGITVSLIISIGVISVGYYFLSEIKDIDEQVSKEDNVLLESIIDKENICNGEFCCLASLQRMKKREHVEYDDATGCPDGYEMKELGCENTLRWCEIIIIEEQVVAPCIGVGELYSILDSPEEAQKQECCEGLIGKKSYDLLDENCTNELEDALVCVNCGDGICGAGENKCNCEEDCVDNLIIEDNKINAALSDEATTTIETIQDTDNDGLSDVEEEILGTDPNNIDTDGDGLTDYREVHTYLKTDPLNPDTDGDGYSDGEEVEKGFNPLGEGKLEP